MKKKEPEFQFNSKATRKIQDEIVFSISVFAENIACYEVKLKKDNTHIGSIHYSKITRTYSYHPVPDLFIYYTTTMLNIIGKAITNADKYMIKKEDLNKTATEIMENKKISGKNQT